ncbi:FAD-dependent monooxygenase [Actinacidiphila acididurans]|uniref:FAD-dependent monooxygenase n=1 Tax=Actinacidiphila acididurans TaxID=2784346 RepID=A0ABS2TVX0_9ACTN|nr:FAD-dependent monooxygenase [Actinacidiphila acididurans]MBM9506435.1 FAD-dependent monooxygenase [Actinacidiphila acididurans]
MAATAADADVIVVGAGPTGLMLAGELRLGGARVVVLDKLAAPTGQSRGLGFTARAMEIFDARGLLPRFGQGPSVETSPMGHFGGTVFDFTALPDAHFGARGIPQSLTEKVLEDWAGELGADIRRGWEFLSLDDGFLTGDAVHLTVRDPHGHTRRLAAGWLVGCDGGSSRVRAAAGFAFPGTDATRGMYLADISGVPLRHRPLGERTPRGMVMAAPLTAGVDRIIVCPDGTPAPDRGHDITFTEVAAAWQHITGEDISAARADWVSSFTDATRQADTYRRGRVLLAGDAAHIHLPAGGQGLSTGVQDAANLGWKLAAVIGGHAPHDLLDTYHTERHAAGRRLLMNTRAQGTVYLGGTESEPLRELFRELIQYDDVKRHLAGIVSHTDLRYDPTTETPDTPDGPRDRSGDSPDETLHPLTGRRFPPRPLTPAPGNTGNTGNGGNGAGDGAGSGDGAGGVRIASLLHAARGVLLDLADNADVRREAAGWHGRVDTTTLTLTSEDGKDGWARILAGATAVLVRPDGYVAWAGTPEAAGGAGLKDLHAALERWFGPSV